MPDSTSQKRVPRGISISGQFMKEHRNTFASALSGMAKRPPMDQPIDIRSELDQAPAKLAGSSQLTGGIKYDYKTKDGHKLFLVLPEGDTPPKRIDNSTEHTFYDHRLILTQDTNTVEDDDGQTIYSNQSIDVITALVTHTPDGQSSEKILSVQTRSRINAGVRLSPIDFGSLDPVYEETAEDYIDYGDCNYNHLVES
jgi:hypothetical protein